MRRRFSVMAVTMLLGANAAWAQSAAPETKQSNSPYTDTVYATDQHMGYSIRTTVLRWLGGVNIARARDTAASAKEGWWGDPTAEVPPEVAKTPSSDR